MKLTAMQMIISVDTGGKFKELWARTALRRLHGGQPCIFVVDGDNLDAPIINGPDAAHNGLDLYSISRYAHLYDLRGEI